MGFDAFALGCTGLIPGVGGFVFVGSTLPGFLGNTDDEAANDHLTSAASIVELSLIVVGSINTVIIAGLITRNARRHLNNVQTGGAGVMERLEKLDKSTQTSQFGAVESGSKTQHRNVTMQTGESNASRKVDDVEGQVQGQELQSMAANESEATRTARSLNVRQPVRTLRRQVERWNREHLMSSLARISGRGTVTPIVADLPQRTFFDESADVTFPAQYKTSFRSILPGEDA